MRLGENNGLALMILRETNGKSEIYLDGETVSVYCSDSNQSKIDHLKAKIACYIDEHMMMDSYRRINFYF